MWLILCSEADEAALWLRSQLKERGMAPLELVAGELLGSALRWEHEVGKDGAWFKVELQDGRQIDSRDVKGAVNRITAAGEAVRNPASAADRQYAMQEFAALLMSALHALPGPVMNRPTASGLSGAWRHPAEWVWMAGQAGLPVLPYVSESPTAPDAGWGWRPVVPYGAPVDTAFVVEDRVTGDVPERLHNGCAALAQKAGASLLGVDFLKDLQGTLWFAGAGPLPDLRRGGPPLVEAVHEALCAGGQR
jgi:hypothetical protein